MCSLFSQLPLVCLTVLYRVCHFSFPNKTNKTILIGYNQDAESLACDIGDVLCIVLHPLAPEAHPPPSGGGEGRKGWEGGAGRAGAVHPRLKVSLALFQLGGRRSLRCALNWLRLTHRSQGRQGWEPSCRARIFCDVLIVIPIISFSFQLITGINS